MSGETRSFADFVAEQGKCFCVPLLLDKFTYPYHRGKAAAKRSVVQASELASQELEVKPEAGRGSTDEK